MLLIGEVSLEIMQMHTECTVNSDTGFRKCKLYSANYLDAVLLVLQFILLPVGVVNYTITSGKKNQLCIK